jgi:hypothetical protein
MKYALLIYITPDVMTELSPEAARSLHGAHQAASTSAEVIDHYRLRPPQLTTTVRLHRGQILKTEGPSAETNEGLRALYLLESIDPDAVLDFAGLHPAVHVGGTAEVWPLITPRRDHSERHGLG